MHTFLTTERMPNKWDMIQCIEKVLRIRFLYENFSLEAE